tara:strand:+ start:8205 stop:8363 length:159 start_codon:yes stop_codon:yes gene_type:complete
MYTETKNAIKKEALGILKRGKPTVREMNWFKNKVTQHVDAKTDDAIWVDNSW